MATINPAVTSAPTKPVRPAIHRDATELAHDNAPETPPET
jgi:hypothetical protein